MSKENEPQIAPADQDAIDTLYNGCCQGDWPHTDEENAARDRLEALATENARLKASQSDEAASLFRQLEAVRGYLEPLCLELGDIRFEMALPLLRNLKESHSRVIANLVDANRRLTALLDETEELL